MNYHDKKHLISATGLKEAAKSMRHYKQYISGDRKETQAMKIGSAIHCYLFEPYDFSDRYVISPSGLDRRTKEGKLWHEANNSKIIIAYDDFISISNAIDAVIEHPLSSMLSMIDCVEHEIYWGDCRMKADAIIKPNDAYPNGCIIDLKSTIDASSRKFSRQAIDLGYHLQAAHYCDGFMHEYGTSAPPSFVFIAAEKSEPFMVQFFEIDQELLDIGFDVRNILIEQIHEAIETGVFEGYSTTIQSLSAPNWLLSGEEITEISYV